MDLTFIYRYLHGKLGVNFSDELQIADVNSGLRSSNHGMRLYGEFVRTETFKASYFNRIVRLWNTLPATLRNCDNLPRFKAGLNSHYFIKLDSYNPESVCRCHNCITNH